jgi:small subunit ribosomal protein S17
MAKETKKQTREIKEEVKNENSSCADKLCPLHGENPLKLRGRIFEGTVEKKFHKRVVIRFERVAYISKYEGYEKRNTKLHARLPDCMEKDINVGDLIQIAECRPLSKIIHFVVVKRIKTMEENK